MMKEHQKTVVIIAVGECGYVFDLEKDDTDSVDVTIYEVDSMVKCQNTGA